MTRSPVLAKPRPNADVAEIARQVMERFPTIMAHLRESELADRETKPEPPCRFRKVGFTADAINFPLTPAGCEVVARHNGVRGDQMPDEFRYAPNSNMKAWLDRLGAEMELGHCVRDDDGRWWTIQRLEEVYG